MSNVSAEQTDMAWLNDMITSENVSRKKRRNETFKLGRKRHKNMT